MATMKYLQISEEVIFKVLTVSHNGESLLIVIETKC